MDYIISDYKNNIKHDFTILESYFINHGEDILKHFIYIVYGTHYHRCIKTMNTEDINILGVEY